MGGRRKPRPTPSGVFARSSTGSPATRSTCRAPRRVFDSTREENTARSLAWSWWRATARCSLLLWNRKPSSARGRWISWRATRLRIWRKPLRGSAWASSAPPSPRMRCRRHSSGCRRTLRPGRAYTRKRKRRSRCSRPGARSNAHARDRSASSFYNGQPMIKAVYPGTFDPLTRGHEDLVRRAATLFDTLIVAIADSKAKRPYFTVDERIAMAREVLGDLKNVQVLGFSGLLTDFVRESRARV